MKRGLLIKRDKNNKSIEIKKVEINKNNDISELHQIYKHLEVDLIDIVTYKNKTIYVDDEGLLKENPKLTMLLKDTNQYLYGNLIIMCDVNEEGETLGISLKDEEMLVDEMNIVLMIK